MYSIQNFKILFIYRPSKRSLLLFIRPNASPIYTIHHPRGLKLMTRLRVGLSHLREHKLHHNFHDTLNPLCFCRTNSIESVEHFPLHSPIYATYRCILFNFDGSKRNLYTTLLKYSSG